MSTLSESEILSLVPSALANEEFSVYFQPQYNHSTGMLVGAEALVRWNSPKYGMVLPNEFIPTLENNNLIPQLDTYVFEQVCKFLKYSEANNLPLIRVSINVSRNDIACEGFIEGLDAIRQKYGVSTKLIHVEITETAIAIGENAVSNAVKKFHDLGYTVEMDDFGSGYSSLNVLKDIEFDVMKLDLKFIAGSIGNSRGGTILSSVVRMAKWLKLPVIAEGVETVEQANFLRSVGCDYIQGYLYSKPIPRNDYESLLNKSGIGAIVPQEDLMKTIDSGKFWNPDSLETLIFSNFVGGAAIIEVPVTGEEAFNRFEVVRVNQKCIRELGMNLSEKEIIHMNVKDTMDEDNFLMYQSTFQKALASKDEEECETWHDMHSKCCGSELICLRNTVRLIAKSKVSCLFYVMVRNITNEQKSMNDMITVESRFRAAAEHANMYFWEYNIRTKEMFPCFRCMRDLGLPPLVRNYPDPLFESGIFPADYARMYYEWMERLAAGEKTLEGIIPLTADRIPFHVRYTTVFDEAGHPIKAFGSATLVVDNK